MAEKLTTEEIITIQQGLKASGEVYAQVIQELLELRSQDSLLAVATAAMQGILSNPILMEKITKLSKDFNETIEKTVSAMAEQQALALIEECGKERK